MSELALIFAFVLVVLFGFVLPIALYSMHTDNKRRLAKLQSGADSEQVARLQDELADVRKRLAVVEQIVTDERFELDRQIARLESA